MLLLIVYDITEPKRLRKVARLLEKYGIRVQNSTFELERENYNEILEKLKKLIDEEEGDKIFIFKISGKNEEKTELAKDEKPWDFII